MLRAPFCKSRFTSIILITFLNGHTREKQYISLILCMWMPQIIPLITLTLVCMWYEESRECDF